MNIMVEEFKGMFQEYLGNFQMIKTFLPAPVSIWLEFISAFSRWTKKTKTLTCGAMSKPEITVTKMSKDRILRLAFGTSCFGQWLYCLSRFGGIPLGSTSYYMNISVLEEEAESKHKISSWGTWGCDVSWCLIGCWTAMHNGLQISFPLGQIIMA